MKRRNRRPLGSLRSYSIDEIERFAAVAVPAGSKAQHHPKSKGLQNYVHPETVSE